MTPPEIVTKIGPYLALSCLIFCPPGYSFAEDEATGTLMDGRRTVRQLPANIGRGLIGLFDRDNLVPFIWSAAAISISFAIEDDVRDKVISDDDGLSEFASDYLGPLGLGVITAGIFVSGRNSDDPAFRNMSYDMGVAVMSNLILTGGIKAVVDRSRPNEGNEKSFPSGHTSNAFAMAAVLEGHYGREAGVPAYIMASLIGASRIRRDAHWLTDVVAGAALGYITGRTVVRQNSKSDYKVTFIPSLSPSFQGLVMQAEF